MKFFVIFFLSLWFSASASAIGLSPLRYSNESYEIARDRSHFISKLHFSRSRKIKNISEISGTAPEDVKKPLGEMNTQEIEELGSYADLENEFKYIRDTRFIRTEDPSFPRRITWMYPDDGCYVRAEMMKYELVAHHAPTPKKIFVFGNLFATSMNSLTGTIHWWYHVAVAYRLGADVYVFDPSIEPRRPLKIQEWDNLINKEGMPIEYSVCSADTVDPTSDCYNPTPETHEDTISTQKIFLDNEWDRLIDLNRKPEEELGNLPPWL